MSWASHLFPFLSLRQLVESVGVARISMLLFGTFLYLHLVHSLLRFKLLTVENNHDPSKLVAETPCELLRDGRDANRNYDPRTLYLPPDFFKSLTGGQDVEMVGMLIEERYPGCESFCIQLFLGPYMKNMKKMDSNE
ncbi:DNA mismatch repair protein MSH6 [Camellia lanceoleosa]|uniref:DNA mismatch repair protein MSH6 n=1 Tax=Camellia lanceoleosa TaxID=1840588 RepID=A0ACC0FNL3_9ERIC|nr:DNA mismatch repair protein MSH6 [Camellia lanceoleosa]